MPLTLQDLADHLNAPLPAEGDRRRREMQRALDTAVHELTRMTGLLDGPATVTVTVAADGRALQLPYVRLTSVAGAPGPVDLLSGVVASAWAPHGTMWTITCTRADPWPSALESAALDWAAHIYDTQRRTLNPTADEDTALPSFALPNRVAQFAQPYLLPGFA